MTKRDLAETHRALRSVLAVRDGSPESEAFGEVASRWAHADYSLQMAFFTLHDDRCVFVGGLANQWFKASIGDQYQFTSDGGSDFWFCVFNRATLQVMVRYVGARE
jgi:hypothetical protein